MDTVLFTWDNILLLRRKSECLIHLVVDSGRNLTWNNWMLVNVLVSSSKQLLLGKYMFYQL